MKTFYNGRAASPENRSGRRKLLWLLSILFVIPAVFAFKWFNSYGQVMVDKEPDSPQFGRSGIESTKKASSNGWYQYTLKSWIYDKPSIEDVLAKDIERSGGWGALKRMATFEIRGSLYSDGCQAVANGLTLGTAGKSVEVTMKFKAPNKFYRHDVSWYDETTQKFRTTYFDGQKAYTRTTINDSEWTEESNERPEFALNGSFFSAATDYSSEFYRFSPVGIGTFNNRTVYSLAAYSKHPLPSESIPLRGLEFDAITGRLTGVIYPHLFSVNQGFSVGFEDHKKVNDVSLPHKMCITGGASQTFIIDSWTLGEPIDDSVFNSPNN